MWRYLLHERLAGAVTIASSAFTKKYKVSGPRGPRPGARHMKQPNYDHIADTSEHSALECRYIMYREPSFTKASRMRTRAIHNMQYRIQITKRYENVENVWRGSLATSEAVSDHTVPIQHNAKLSVQQQKSAHSTCFELKGMISVHCHTKLRIHMVRGSTRHHPRRTSRTVKSFVNCFSAALALWQNGQYDLENTITLFPWMSSFTRASVAILSSFDCVTPIQQENKDMCY